MRLCYIKWRDAVMESDDASHASTAASVELEEVGWLLDENADAVLIGMEHPREGYQVGRGRLHVPRRNIVEMRVVDFGKAFPRKSVVWQS